MWLGFQIDLFLFFSGILTVSDVNQGLSHSLPSGDFPGVGDVPFRDAIRHKYSIKIPKEHVILLRIGFDPVKGLCDMGLLS